MDWNDFNIGEGNGLKKLPPLPTLEAPILTLPTFTLTIKQFQDNYFDKIKKYGNVTKQEVGGEGKEEPLNKQLKPKPNQQPLSSGRKYIGIQNVGNTCFYNAMLQLLWDMKSVKEFFLNLTLKKIESLEPLTIEDLGNLSSDSALDDIGKLKERPFFSKYHSLIEFRQSISFCLKPNFKIDAVNGIGEEEKKTLNNFNFYKNLLLGLSTFFQEYDKALKFKKLSINPSEIFITKIEEGMGEKKGGGGGGKGKRKEEEEGKKEKKEEKRRVSGEGGRETSLGKWKRRDGRGGDSKLVPRETKRGATDDEEKDLEKALRESLEESIRPIESSKTKIRTELSGKNMSLSVLFYFYLKMKDSSFVYRAQTDTTEFFNILNDSLNCFLMNDEIYNVWKSFSLKQKQFLLKEDKKTETPSLFTISKSIQLPITTGQSNIQDLIAQYTTIENAELERGEVKFSYKKTSLEVFPETQNIVIQLNRFKTINLKGDTEKVKTEVTPNQIITINTIEFKLIGCCIHIGDNLNSGHYVYLTFDDKGNPDKVINDGSISSYSTIKDVKVFSSNYLTNGYIYLYERMGEVEEKVEEEEVEEGEGEEEEKEEEEEEEKLKFKGGSSPIVTSYKYYLKDYTMNPDGKDFTYKDEERNKERITRFSGFNSMTSDGEFKTCPLVYVNNSGLREELTDISRSCDFFNMELTQMTKDEYKTWLKTEAETNFEELLSTHINADLKLSDFIKKYEWKDESLEEEDTPKILYDLFFLYSLVAAKGTIESKDELVNFLKNSDPWFYNEDIINNYFIEKMTIQIEEEIPNGFIDTNKDDNYSFIRRINTDKKKMNKFILIGDLHGSFATFFRILLRLIFTGIIDESFKVNEEYGIIFLGDILDRGVWDYEILVTVFFFKIYNPENIYIIRGNHEELSQNSQDESGLKTHFPYHWTETIIDEIHSRINTDILQNLPSAIVISYPNSDSSPPHKYVYLAHGGLPVEIDDTQTVIYHKIEFEDENDYCIIKNENAGSTNTSNMRWNDFTGVEETFIWGKGERRRGNVIGTNITKDIGKKDEPNNIELVIRGHQDTEDNICVVIDGIGDDLEKGTRGKIVSIENLVTTDKEKDKKKDYLNKEFKLQLNKEGNLSVYKQNNDSYLFFKTYNEENSSLPIIPVITLSTNTDRGRSLKSDSYALLDLSSHSA